MELTVAQTQGRAWTYPDATVLVELAVGPRLRVHYTSSIQTMVALTSEALALVAVMVSVSPAWRKSARSVTLSVPLPVFPIEKA